MRSFLNILLGVIVLMSVFDAIAAYRHSEACPVVMEKKLYYAGPGYLIGCAVAGYVK